MEKYTEPLGFRGKEYEFLIGNSLDFSQSKYLISLV